LKEKSSALFHPRRPSPYLHPETSGSFPHYLVQLAQARAGLVGAQCPRGASFDEWDLSLLATVLPPSNVRVAGEGWEEKVLSSLPEPPEAMQAIMKASE